MKLLINNEEFPIVIEKLLWDNDYKTGAKAYIKLTGNPSNGFDFGKYTGGVIMDNNIELFNNVIFLDSNYSSILLIKSKNKI